MKPIQSKYEFNDCDKLLLLAHVAEGDYCKHDDKRNQISREKLHKKIKPQTNVRGCHKSLQVKPPSGNIFDMNEQRAFKSERKHRVVRTATFAMKLMSVMENKTYRHFVSWIDDGNSFIILDQDMFTRCVLPSEFKTAKYESFTRKLYRWGFRRVANSMKDRAFYHPLFLRNHPRLCRRMRSGNLVDELGVLG